MRTLLLVSQEPRRWLLITSIIVGFVWPASISVLAQSSVPRIFYSDLDSGPSSGGENNLGAYVTIYGRSFGATQGSATITIGGATATAYPIWNDTKVTFQLGAGARSGDIVVHTRAGDSNAISFTVRAGNIYFVATSGNDAASGSFAQPWRTIQHAVETIAPGDTVYVMDGVVETRRGSSDGSVEISSSGTPGQPKALVAYPGANATIGSPGSGVCISDSCVEGLLTLNLDVPYNDWTIAGLNLRGNNTAFSISGGRRPSNLSSRWRVVGNDFSCPYIHSLSGPGCVTFSQTQYIKFYGNNVHDVGRQGDSVQEYGQGLYFTTDTIHVDAGWNTVANVRGCRCVQVHSSPLANGDASDPTGYNQFDITIHDNLIHDCGCDGLLFWSVDPAQGPVSAYNNVIYNAGAGPPPSSGSGNFSCIYMAATTNNSAAPTPSGAVEVFNNTLYNCGGANLKDRSEAVRSGSGDTISPNLSLRLRNNIIQLLPGQFYSASNTNPLTGSNNLWFGAGPPPASDSRISLTDNLNSNPLFVDPAKGDFHLQSNSPARNAGVNTGLATDKEGAPRTRGSAFDLGAYTFAVSGPRPSPGIASLSCQPALVMTPGTVTCTVSLSATAPSGGVTIRIASNNSNLVGPALVTVPAEQSSTTFAMIAAGVAGQQVVTLTAGLDEVVQTFSLTLMPPATSISLSISPSALSFNYQLGGGAPQPQGLTIASSGAILTFSVSSSARWLTVSPTSGTTPAFLSVLVNPSDLSAGTYTGFITITAPVAVIAQTLTVTLSISGMPGPAVSAVVNGASFAAEPVAAPGSILSIFGSQFGLRDNLSAFPITEFDGTTVTMNATPAPLFAVAPSRNQINVLAPTELPESGFVPVQVRTASGGSTPFSITMVSAAPGIFRVPNPSNPALRNAAALFGNTAWLAIPVSMARALGIPDSCASMNARSICGQPAAAGDILQVFVTGLGKATPSGDPNGHSLATGSVAPPDGNPLYRTVASPNVTIGDIPAPVLFSGLAPGFAGLYQVNVRVPGGVPAGDDVTVRVSMPNGRSDAATIAIRR